MPYVRVMYKSSTNSRTRSALHRGSRIATILSSRLAWSPTHSHVISHALYLRDRLWNMRVPSLFFALFVVLVLLVPQRKNRVLLHLHVAERVPRRVSIALVRERTAQFTDDDLLPRRVADVAIDQVGVESA